MHTPTGRDDVNVRCASYLLARTVGPCRHCRARTPLLGLALPPGHETLEPDDESNGDAGAADNWRTETGAAFVFHVEYLPAAVQGRIRQFNRQYRLIMADPALQAASRWANHCRRCALALDDDELFGELEGAFLPIDESGARSIVLLPVDEPFEAVAGGYTHEPQFFHAMSQGAAREWQSTI